MSRLPLPELFIFDMDGLIFDTERLFMNTKGKVLETYGYVQHEADYQRTLGTCGAQLNAILHDIYGPDYPAEEISRKTRALVTEQIRAEGPPVKYGIRTLLSWIQSRKIPCCVASSTQHAYVEEYLKLANLYEYFTGIIGGDEIQRSKPNPDIFLAACTRTHVSPAQALVLEDSENGILAASSAGIPVICIPDLKIPEASILDKTAAVVSDAEKVIGLF